MRIIPLISGIALAALILGTAFGWPIPAAISFAAFPARFVLIAAVLALPPLGVLRRSIRSALRKRGHASEGEAEANLRGRKLLTVTGMACGHCAMKVESELLDVPGVDEAKVDVQTGKAMVFGNGMNDAALEAAVAKAGYRVTDILPRSS